MPPTKLVSSASQCVPVMKNASVQTTSSIFKEEIVQSEPSTRKISRMSKKKKNRRRKNTLNIVDDLAIEEIESRDIQASIDLSEEISTVIDTFNGGIVEVVSKPSETSKGELLVSIRNEFNDSVRLECSFKLTFPFLYPSATLQISLVDYYGIKEKDIESFTADIQTTNYNFSKVCEPSLFDTVAAIVRKIEEWEREADEEIKKKKLFELQRKEKELELRRKEMEMKEELENKKKIEEETLEKNVKERIDFMKGDLPVLKSTNSNIWSSHLKRQKIESIIQNDRLSSESENEELSPQQIQAENLKFNNITERSGNECETYSRFKNDFEMVNLLGKGGFGSVYKVINRLDGNFYAIKQMILNYNYPSKVKKIMQEVQLLSKLNHHHIVRYYQAWTEPVPNDEINQKVEGSGSEDDKEYEEEQEEEDSSESNSFDEDTHSRQSSQDGGQGFTINFGDEQTPSLENDDGFDIRFDEDSNNNNLQINFDQDDSEEDKFDIKFGETTNNKDSKWMDTLNKDMEDLKKPKNRKTANLKYLFIQMECCEAQTLREFINKGSIQFQNRLYKKLLTQILEGLAYVHKQHLIHRDLKPNNIFLDKGLNVKLGDFGLATKKAVLHEKVEEVKKEETQLSSRFFSENSKTKIDESTNLSFGIGTPIYMSPEQAKQNKYDCKADMYSLGIIVFEMVYSPFKSEMERIVSLSTLRNKKEFPKDFDQRCGGVGSKARKFILELLSEDSTKRPNSRDLFKIHQDSLYQDMIISDVEEYKKILSFLFSSRNMFPSNINTLKDDTISDLREQLTKWVSKDGRISHRVSAIIEEIFRIHDYEWIEMSPSLPSFDKFTIFRANTNQSDKNTRIEYTPRIVELGNTPQEELALDKNGSLLRNCKSLIIPFSRMLSRFKVSKMKCYCKSHQSIHVSDDLLKNNSLNRFRVFCMAVRSQDIDCEDLNKVYSSINEFELVFMVQNLIENCSYFLRNEIQIILSHTGLVDLLTSDLGISPDSPKYLKVLDLIAKYNQMNADDWNSRLNIVFKNEKKKINKLLQFCKIETSTVEEFRIQLQSLFITKSKLLELILHKLLMLESLLSSTRFRGSNIKFTGRHNYSQTWTYHGGIVFEALYTGYEKNKTKSKHKKRKEFVIAKGGHFENSIDHFMPRDHITKYSAIGIQINAYYLVELMAQYLEASNLRPSHLILESSQPPPKSAQFGVLVISFIEEMILEKMRMCSRLWKEGIRAVYDINPASTQNVKNLTFGKRGFTHLIIMKPSVFGSTEKVKLKSLKCGKEFDIHWESIVSTLNKGEEYLMKKLK